MSHVIFRPELQMLQYKGQRVVVRLFEIFEANPKRLLPHPVFAQYEHEGHGVAGQTEDDAHHADRGLRPVGEGRDSKRASKADQQSRADLPDEALLQEAEVSEQPGF